MQATLAGALICRDITPGCRPGAGGRLFRRCNPWRQPDPL